MFYLESTPQGRSLGLTLTTFVLATLTVVGTSAGEEAEWAFPESHKYFLGSSSYGALFGPMMSSATPSQSMAPGGTGSPPRVGANVQMNDPQSSPPDGLLGRSETTIATDPSGRFLLSGWNDADGFCGPPFNSGACTGPLDIGLSGYAWSADGGATWTDGGAPFVIPTDMGTKVTRGDPWMDTGGPGQKSYYYANIAVDETTGDPGFGGMTVHTGSFEDELFGFDYGVFIPQPNPNPADFLDKEALCAGKGGRAKDDVSVVVTNFMEVAGIPFFGFGQIEAYVSTDRAQSFPTRTIVQPDETIDVPTNAGIINQGSTCAYGRKGELYLAWERGYLSPFFGQAAAGVYHEIVFAASFDGGASFGPRVLISDISPPGLFPPGGYNRSNYNDFPRIAVALSGPYKGRIYVTYQDSQIANGGPQNVAAPGPEDIPCSGGAVDCGHWDADVYLSYSDDKGITWSTPTLVAGGGDGLLQFWPVVTVQDDGDVVVTYNESLETEIPDFLNGNGTGTSLVDIFSATSTDGGTTFGTPMIITEVTTDWGATATNIIPNFGDYIFHVSTSSKDLITWADGRNGVPDAFYATVKTN